MSDYQNMMNSNIDSTQNKGASFRHQWMLVGAIEAGKSTLFNALQGLNDTVRKTQAMDFYEGMIDTPGEFFSHPRMYRALINTAAEVDTIIYVHAANDFEFRLPQGLLEVNRHKRLIGLITKTDLADANPDKVEAMMREHGFTGEILRICAIDPLQVIALKKFLQQDNY